MKVIWSWVNGFYSSYHTYICIFSCIYILFQLAWSYFCYLWHIKLLEVPHPPLCFGTTVMGYSGWIIISLSMLFGFIIFLSYSCNNFSYTWKYKSLLYGCFWIVEGKGFYHFTLLFMCGRMCVWVLKVIFRMFFWLFFVSAETVSN